MDATEVAAREAIRDLVARYHQSGDAGRLEELAALFLEDAVLELPARRCEGRAAILRLFEAAAGSPAEGPVALRHFLASHQIDVDGPGSARGRAYYLVLTGDGLDHWGRYVDAYRLGPSGWRFAHRRVSVDGRVPGGWAERALARV